MPPSFATRMVLSLYGSCEDPAVALAAGVREGVLKAEGVDEPPTVAVADPAGVGVTVWPATLVGVAVRVVKGEGVAVAEGNGVSVALGEAVTLTVAVGVAELWHPGDASATLSARRISNGIPS